MTPQEMFNTAYLKVIQQGHRSVKANGGCVYRGANGSKCAIGHIIPDDLAKAWDQRTNSSILHIRSTPKYPVPDFIRNNRRLAADIQQAHDDGSVYDQSSFINDFKQRMAIIAKDYKLTVPELETN